MNNCITKKIFSIIVGLLLFAAPAIAVPDGYYRGDLNGDKKVDTEDLAALIYLLLSPPKEMPLEANVNGTNKVDKDDVLEMVQIILGKKEKVWVEVYSNLSTNGSITLGNANESDFKEEFDARTRR